MYLIGKDLNVLLALQVRLELLHVLGGLVAGREHADRDFDVRGIRGVDHGGVAFSSGAEGRGGCGGREGDDLPAPAETDNAPGLDARVFCLHILDERQDFRDCLGRCAGCLEEVS